jgi:trigger factor
MEPEALRRVKYRYLIDEVANAEKIEVSDEEASEEAGKMAEHYGMEKDEFLKQFGGLEVVKYDLRMHKALDILSK